MNPSPSTRFARGRSGNPGGRPKGPTIVSQLREILKLPLNGSETTAEEDLVSKMLDLALVGNLQAIKLVLAYTEGQPVARQEQGEPGAFGDPLEDIPIETLRKALKLIK